MTAAAKSPQKAQRELEDLQLVLKARNGSSAALDVLIRRYTSFVRLKASSYFLVGGEPGKHRPNNRVRHRVDEFDQDVQCLPPTPLPSVGIVMGA